MKIGQRSSAIALDVGALALCVIALVPILMASFSDSGRAEASEPDRPPIGSLERRLEDVRRRSDSGLVWGEIAIGETVRQGDAIYVGTDSAASVVLDDGARIDIEENSLVVVELARDEGEPDPGVASIAVVRGGAAPTAGRGRLSLRVGKSDVALSGGSRAEVRVSDERGARVAVTAGSADLTTADGAKTNLREGQRGEADGSVSNLVIALESPAAGERLFGSPDFAEVRFRWQPLPGSGEYTFELSADGDFSALVATGRTAGNERVEPRVSPGVYYWRVRRTGAQGEQLSPERRLIVVRDEAPVPYAPAAGTDVIAKAGKPLPLAWSTISGAPAYELQLARSADGFAAPVFSGETARPSFRLAEQLSEGEYCYRVRVLETGRQVWSKPRCFRVVLTPVLGAPEVKGHHRETVPRGAGKKKKGKKRHKPKGSWLFHLVGSVAHAGSADSAIVLRWVAIPGAVAYRLEIAEDKEFRRVVVAEKTNGTYYSWKTVTRRVYYWRVRGIDAGGREGAASLPTRIDPEVSAPTLIEPRNGHKVYYGTAPPKLTLQWKPSEVLKQYRVEISTSSDFSAAATTKLTTAESSHLVVGKALGTFHWRVTGIDLTGEPTPASEVRSFAVLAATPAATSPKRDEVLVWKEEKLSVPLAWTWRPVRSYEIQAALDPSFAKDRIELSSRDKGINLEPPGPGLVHWRVRGVSPRTGWSETSTFVVRPGTPTLASPEEGARIEYDGASAALELRWGAVPRVTTYEVELAKEWTDSEEPLRVEQVAGEVARFTGLTAGRYSWTVRAVAGETQGESSPTRSLELVALSSTVTAAPGDGPPNGGGPGDPPPKLVEPVEPNEPVLFLGPRVGMLVNLGAIVSPRFGATALYRLPVLGGALAVSLAADYYLAFATITDPGGDAPDFASELHAVPIELLGSYVLETEWLDVRLGLGVAFVISYISVSSTDQDSPQDLGQVTVDGGAVAAVEAAKSLGPGRIFLAVSFALTSWNGGELGENNPGGLTLAAGYRFGIY